MLVSSKRIPRNQQAWTNRQPDHALLWKLSSPRSTATLPGSGIHFRTTSIQGLLDFSFWTTLPQAERTRFAFSTTFQAPGAQRRNNTRHTPTCKMCSSWWKILVIHIHHARNPVHVHPESAILPWIYMLGKITISPGWWRSFFPLPCWKASSWPKHGLLFLAKTKMWFRWWFLVCDEPISAVC